MISIMKMCPECGTLNNFESNACENCKTSLSNAECKNVNETGEIICPSCGEPNAASAAWCIKCNTSLSYNSDDVNVKKTDFAAPHIAVSSEASGSKLAILCAVIIGVCALITGLILAVEDVLLMLIIWGSTILAVIPLIMIYFHFKNQEKTNDLLTNILDRLPEKE